MMFKKKTFKKKTFKKTTLALSVLWAASVAGGAQAASSFSEEASSFLDDSTMTIGLRTHYYEAREDYKNPADKNAMSDALVQGVRLNYKSGYLYDLFAIDMNVYSAIDLITHDDKGTWYALDDDLPRDQRGNFTKASAVAKLNLLGYGELRYGNQFLDTPLYGNSDSRLTPEEAQATTYWGAFGSLDLYALHLMREYPRHNANLNHFENRKGEDNTVDIVGGSYRFDNSLKVQAAYGQQDDVSKQYFISGEYTFDLGDVSTTVSGNYQNISADGYDKEAANQNGTQDDIDVFSGRMDIGYGPATLSLAYGKTGKFDDSDVVLNWRGGIENGGTNLLTDEDYYIQLDRSDMQSYLAGLSYDFSSFMPGLTVRTVYQHGKNDYQSNFEAFVRFEYAVPSVKNLWLSAAYVWGENTDSREWTGSEVDGNNVDWHHTRLQLHYQFDAL